MPGNRVPPPRDAPTLPPLREVIARHGLSARRGLGQNFLLDLNLTRRIARAGGAGPGIAVLEIGPGPGGLTRAILEAGASVIAIEADSRCLPALEELSQAYPGRLTVVGADALEVDEPALLAEHEVRTPVKVIANLPYNVATPLLMKWLKAEPWPPWYADLTLMFQKEVADRLAAGPGPKVYGRPSILVQWRCLVKRCFDVPARAFVPPPKVTSTLITVTPRARPAAPADMATLEAVVAAAFGQRRKMLRSSLTALDGVGGAQGAAALLGQAGIDGARRAETLAITEFCALARAWAVQRPDKIG